MFFEVFEPDGVDGFQYNFLYKMCDSRSFLGPAVQLLTLGAFKTEALEQKLTMTKRLTPIQELLFKGRKSLEVSV